MKIKVIIASIIVFLMTIISFNVKAAQNNVYDLSEWQGNFTDSQVQQFKKEVPFVILRVQYGSAYYDKTFDHNRNLLDKYKVPYGVYSFSQYESISDAKNEARVFYKRAPNAKFYVNDYEDQTVKSGGTNEATLAWLNELRPLVGKRKILFYSYQSFMLQHASEAISAYDGYWLAAYQSTEPTREHVLWQYTDHYYSPALGKYIDSSLLTTKKSDWFIGNNSQSVVENTKYYNYNFKFKVKSAAQHNFYNHVFDDNKYKSKLALNKYGTNYKGKTVDVNKKAVVNGKTYYRCYHNSKLLGWINVDSLSAYIDYQNISEYKTIKVTPKNNFYNHIPGSHFSNIRMVHHGKSYANKKVKVLAKAKKHGSHSYYYKCSYNGKHIGWIYQSAF
ncbi:GW dipeptide domain-containing protein [Apilactobacillus sp. TMW 2.2459]|uniref:GH25 family lysozyme n=1 Tax=Apilactobacillus xinyiensis TaxID=2841032 RepID=UPI00200D71ED|nr:GH25 family lysozyme [Apilactobacillus xinyiensis]MCL0312446.1 GW dipeptide domain-containing protein [Apilactobacillus xinyiensis]